MIKRRSDSSLSWLYLTNNTIVWKDLQALLREIKTKKKQKEKTNL